MLRPMMRFRSLFSFVIALLGVAGVASACGGSSGGSDVATLSGKDAAGHTTSTTIDIEDAARNFAKCMREHGIDMPDPQVSTGAGGKGGFVKIGGPRGSSGSRPNQAKFEAAQKACEHFMQGAVNGGKRDLDPEEEAKMRDQALAFAKCMRDHGVDFPDPKFEGGGRMTQSLGVDPNDPNFVKAQESCAKEFGGKGPMTIGGGE
jgi:hypothetical protein